MKTPARVMLGEGWSEDSRVDNISPQPRRVWCRLQGLVGCVHDHHGSLFDGRIPFVIWVRIEGDRIAETSVDGHQPSAGDLQS